jgi:hypothetical protein
MKGVENIILRVKDEFLPCHLIGDDWDALGCRSPRDATKIVRQINDSGLGVIAIPTLCGTGFSLWPIDPDAYRMA